MTEDEKMVRDLVGTILRDQGYTVLLAADGNEALQLSTNHPGGIDLLLTDMVMPGMSGPELAKNLLRMRPAAKVLYMSGYTEYALMDQGVYERVQTFIWKPFTNSGLVQKIREVLDTPQTTPG
ncbi:MAG: response regulator [Acidobacteriota bacterium]